MVGDWVCVNGKFVEKENAVVSVFDHGFVYGDGVFEGIAIVGKAIFKLDQHIARLYKSAQYLAIEPQVSQQEMTALALESARRNSVVDGYLRIVMSRGAGPVGIRNMDQLGAPTIVMIAQHEDRAQRMDVYKSGQGAIMSSVRRVPSEAIDAKAKTCNYVNNILAYLEARSAGVKSAIMLDTRGLVAECYAANIFAVANDKVVTPPLGSILNGITRQTVLKLCAELRIDHAETDLTPHDLYCADEVFETGSLAELKPIIRIGDRPIGSGVPGPVTRKLHTALRVLMESGTESVAY